MCFFLCVQISPYLLTLPDRLAKVLGGAGPSGADQWSTPDWSIPVEDQGAAQAVWAAGHPAAGLLVGEGLAVA